MANHKLPSFKVIDLTHTMTPSMPVMHGDPEVRFFDTETDKGKATHADGDGLTPSRPICLAEHTGTHLDAPAHYDSKGLTVDRLPVQSLLNPAVMLDFREEAAHSHGYRLSLEEFFLWEEEHGYIPPNAMVILQTGWAFNWDTEGKYLARDSFGSYLFPGYGAEVVTFLVEERMVSCLGIDTPSIDVGRSTSFPSHRAVLGKGVPCVENLTNCHLLPDRDFLVVVAPLKVGGAMGAPARVLALIPK